MLESRIDERKDVAEVPLVGEDMMSSGRKGLDGVDWLMSVILPSSLPSTVSYLLFRWIGEKTDNRRH